MRFTYARPPLGGLLPSSIIALPEPVLTGTWWETGVWAGSSFSRCDRATRSALFRFVRGACNLVYRVTPYRYLTSTVT